MAEQLTREQVRDMIAARREEITALRESKAQTWTAPQPVWNHHEEEERAR